MRRNERQLNAPGAGLHKKLDIAEAAARRIFPVGGDVLPDDFFLEDGNCAVDRFVMDKAMGNCNHIVSAPFKEAYFRPRSDG